MATSAANAIAAALLGAQQGGAGRQQVGAVQPGVPAMPWGKGEAFFSPHGVMGVNQAELPKNTLGQLAPTVGYGAGPQPVVPNPGYSGLLPNGTIPGSGGMTPGGVITGPATPMGKTNNKLTPAAPAAPVAPANTGVAQRPSGVEATLASGLTGTELSNELTNLAMASGRPPAGGYGPGTTNSATILAAVRAAAAAGNFNGNPLDALAQYGPKP